MPVKTTTKRLTLSQYIHSLKKNELELLLWDYMMLRYDEDEKVGLKELKSQVKHNQKYRQNEM